MITKQQQNQMAVIGAALLDADACRESLQRLTPEMFEDGPFRVLFEAIRGITTAGKALDVVTLEGAVGSDYRKLIAQAAECVPTISHVADYEALVLEDYRRRLLLESMAALTVSLSSSDAICSQLQKCLDRQNAIRSAALDESTRSFDQVLDEAVASLEEPDNVLRLGWRAIDAYGLFERTNTVVISGRPGGGKTDFAMNLAARFSKRYRVYYLTMEETRKKLMFRILSKVTRIDSGRMRDKDLDGDEIASIRNAAAALKQHHNMMFDDGENLTVDNIRAKLLRHKPDIAFIDHIGLISASDAKAKEVERLTEATRELKIMAKTMGIVVVELVQLNRNTDRTGGTRSAKLADLRGSGTIEQDANCVLYVENNNEDSDDELRGADAYKDVPIRIGKNRDGAMGRFTMRWQPQYHNWEPAPDPADDFREIPGPLPAAVQQQFDDGGTYR